MEGRKTARSATALALLFGALTILTVVGFVARPWQSEAASRHGTGVDGVIAYLLWATGAIFVLGHLVLIRFLWTYGRRPTEASPQTDPRTERRWSIIPVIAMTLIAEVGVLLMGLPVWAEIYAEAPEDAVRLEVTARQFEWLVHYPGKDGVFGKTDLALVSGMDNPLGLDENDPAAADDLVFTNEIHVPVGKTVVVRLTSRDVLHSFAVPAFRTKQDVVPGLAITTQFVPTKPGRYELACAELCGLGHYRMHGIIVVHDPDAYAAWLAGQTGWFE